MGNLIDISFLIILAYFCWTGLKKGFLTSLLKNIQIILVIILSLCIGFYSGNWAAEILSRPRIVVIPVFIILCGSLTFFISHIFISYIHEKSFQKFNNQGSSSRIINQILGAIFGFIYGGLVISIIFWSLNLSFGIFTENKVDILKNSRTAFNTEKVIYFSINSLLKKSYPISQASNLASSISNPIRTIDRIKIILSSKSIQNFIYDIKIQKDIMSGNIENIKNNESFKKLKNDKITIKQLESLGINYAELSNYIYSLSKNEKIRISVSNLRAKDLLNDQKIWLLIRDPDLDIIIGELLK